MTKKKHVGRKKALVKTVRVPTNLASGVVELIDSIIMETKEYKSRSDFLEKGAWMLVDQVIARGDRRESIKAIKQF